MYVQCGCAIFIRTWISTENGRVHGLWHQWWVKHFRWPLNSWLFDSCTAALCENLFFKQHLYPNRCLNFQTEFWILGGVNSSWFYSLYSGVYLIELAWSYWLWIILESAELCHTPLASLSSVTVFFCEWIGWTRDLRVIRQSLFDYLLLCNTMSSLVAAQWTSTFLC